MDTARQVRELIDETEAFMRELKRDGRTVYLIWDFDFVIADGRSHDVYEAVDRDVGKYHEHEKRLLFQIMREGAWASTARKRGELYDRGYILTARSGAAAIRAQLFCLARNMPIWDMYFVGSASKRCNYDLIFSRHKPEPEAYFILVEDSERHVKDFNLVAHQLGLLDRARAVLTPQLRDYTMAEHRERTLEIIREADAPFYAGDGSLAVPGAERRFLKAMLDAAGRMGEDILIEEDPLTANTLARLNDPPETD